MLINSRFMAHQSFYHCLKLGRFTKKRTKNHQTPSQIAKHCVSRAALLSLKPMSDDPDASLRASLNRHRLFATSLLALMAALAIIGYLLPASLAVNLLRDSAKAGLIGGVADWFAVTALFRHPLGLPIPHTAILPAQKQRLGDALGRFIANHVMTEGDIRKLLSSLDTPGMIRRFLVDQNTTRPLAAAIAAMTPRLLTTIEDGQARRLAGRLLTRLAGGRAAGAIIARVLTTLVEGGRHQEVFSFVLNQLKETLRAREDVLREAIKERVREQGGRLVGWAIGATIATRVLTSVNAELDRVSPDSSEMRDAFDEWARREIARLESDPARAAELGRALQNVVTHESVRIWAGDIWARLRESLVADSIKPQGRITAALEGALASLGESLASDQAARTRVELGIETLVINFLPAAQAELAAFIGRVIGTWDTETITDKLELRVGKDLQYIRVNGTLVGFVLGLLISLASLFIFGQAK